MAVLVAAGLEEADGGERGGARRRADGGDELVEVAHVVLVVGGVELRDAVDEVLGVGADGAQRSDRDRAVGGLGRVRWWGLAVDA